MPLALLSLCVLSILSLVLPGDSSIRLAFHFNAARLSNWVRDATSDRDAWLREPASYPVNLRDDVGYLIKTGYGTRHRIPAQQEAFALTGGILGAEGRSFMVVGDWTTANDTDARMLGVDVHDAIRLVMESDIGARMQDHHRFRKYRTLQEAVDVQDEAKAERLGQSFGWELDALKFIVGLELIYRQMPNKKWYIILDDDTYLITPTLQLLLSHLDPREPQYIGNAVGDFKGRFAHGGSGILLSGEAVRRLFARPDVVARAYADSLDETWGDRLVATTLQKLGIYLDERYSHYFNGEPPEITRIAPDRFCSPLLSFHGLRHAGAMQAVGRALVNVDKPVLWSQLWRYFGTQPVRLLVESRGGGEAENQDHVGPGDELVQVWERVDTPAGCRTRCEASRRGCIAWTHDRDTRVCRASPWVVMGSGDAERKTSGVNWAKLAPLMQQCA
ncbi:family 31 glycosyltransferase [Stachybotrys elegans]|uniref:N-acetylgalactosaminide beta-1,3-galactosyltransferase n=1 Tax=Stachybotrys elegans TaxID=80388 RepID=A0A8K0T4X2_9HYPO|nr:family 31 glycosyltransferase [Stachybotrys elegans]